MDFNKVLICGRIAGVPQYFPNKEDSTKSRLLLTIAVNHQKGDGADFIPVVLWSKTADAGAKFLNKGKEVTVEGKINAKFDKEKGIQYLSVNASDIRYGSDSKKVQQEKQLNLPETESNETTAEKLAAAVKEEPKLIADTNVGDPNVPF